MCHSVPMRLIRNTSALGEFLTTWSARREGRSEVRIVTFAEGENRDYSD